MARKRTIKVKLKRKGRLRRATHKRKVGVTHFAHHAKNTRAVGAKLEGVSFDDFSDASESDHMSQELMERLKDAGEVIANYCRIRASRFSVRIPDSLRVKNDTDTVYIEGGGPSAPNAYPFDPPSDPPVWHPVHAHGPRRKWNWAPQPYRPFLEEGAEDGGDEAAEKFAKIIDDWANEIGSDRP